VRSAGEGCCPSASTIMVCSQETDRHASSSSSPRGPSGYWEVVDVTYAGGIQYRIVPVMMRGLATKRLQRLSRSALHVFLATTLASWPVHAQLSPPPSNGVPETRTSVPSATGPFPAQPYAPGPLPASAPYPPGPLGVYPPEPYPPSSPYQGPVPWPYPAPMYNHNVATGGVFVELQTSSTNVRIDKVLASGMTVPVCLTPCRQILPRGSVYVIKGDGIPATSQFVLPDDRDQVTLTVEAGSSGEALAGLLLVATGAGVGSLGMIVGLFSSMGDTAESPSQAASTTKERHAALGMMLGGAAAGLLGLLLLHASRTTVFSSTGSRFTDASMSVNRRSRFALTPRGLEF
jgi:hypothetical protein